MENHRPFLFVLALSASMTLTACGGGSGSSVKNESDTATVEPVESTTYPPTVQATSVQTVDEGESFVLSADASDPDGSITDYQWSQVAGTSVAFEVADETTITVTAPEISTDESLIFKVTVTSDDGETSSDEISVNVLNIEPENMFPVASAGDDKTVVSADLVELTGSASDQDGTIVSGTWLQESGPGVILSSANTESATFTAPDVIESTELTFSFTVTDNDGGTHSDSVTVFVKYEEPGVFGRVTFERFNFIDSPITFGNVVLDLDNPVFDPARRVVVEILDDESNVVAATVSDNDGNYSFSDGLLLSGRAYALRVKAHMEFDDTIDDGFKLLVTDQSTAEALEDQSVYHYVDDSFSYNGEHSVQNLTLTSGWNAAEKTFAKDASYAQPFAILDSVYKAASLLESGGAEFDDSLPTLYVNWTRETGFTERDGGFYDHIRNRIFLNGDISHANTDDADNYVAANEYNQATIAHEFTHFYQRKVIGRDDSRGGYHFGFAPNDLGLAMSEGLANAISYASLGEWRDSRMPSDIVGEASGDNYYEIAQGETGGCQSHKEVDGTVIVTDCYEVTPYTEAAVAYFVLSLIDKERDSTRWTTNLSEEFGLRSLHSALQAAADSSATMTVFSLAEELKRAEPEHALAINDLGDKLNMNFQDKWGTDQYALDSFIMSNGDILPEESYLPVHSLLTDSSATQLCFNGGTVHGNHERPGRLRYVRYQSDYTGMVTLTLPNVTDSYGKEINFRLGSYVKGESADSSLLYPNGNLEQMEFRAQASQDYIIRVGIFSYDGDVNQTLTEPETVCSILSVTPS